MFYNHEILTSRKHGVATVWVVATLGSKSSLRKLNRKAILDVDIPGACKVVSNPEVPMALRLQSNLLYGLSRVYDQQCGFMLSDTKALENHIKQDIKAIRNANLDVEVGRSVRPHQLLLPDDPNFFPDFSYGSLTMDLSTLELPRQSPSSASLQSPLSSQAMNQPGIMIPSVDYESIGRFDFDGGFGPDSASTPAQGTINRISSDRGFTLDVDFTYDPLGNMRSVDYSEKTVDRPSTHTQQRDPATTTELQTEPIFGEDMEDYVPNVTLDMDLNFQTENDLQLAIQDDQINGSITAQPFPTAVQRDVTPASAVAGMRRNVRIPKLDRVTEVRNTEIAAWQNSYLENMIKAAALKLKGRMLSLAKRNAEYWIWGQGVGRIGSLLDQAGTPGHPLSVFYGETLREAIISQSSIAETGQKRRFEEAIDTSSSDEQGRRVRLRSVARTDDDDGDQYYGVDDTEGFPNTFDQELEIGRTAPSLTPMENSQDVSLVMPWNVSTTHSQPSSNLYQALSAPGSYYRASANSAPFAQRRVSRLASFSPLYNRGIGFSDALPLPESASMSGDPYDSPGVHGYTSFQDDDDFELFEPAAFAETQVETQSQRHTASFDDETENFKIFIENMINQQAPTEGVSPPADQQTQISFEQLLPTNSHSTAVAAQGFLHMLVLATRGLLDIIQNEAYGDIVLCLVAA